MGQEDKPNEKGTNGGEASAGVGSSTIDDSYLSLRSPMTCKSCVSTLAEILNRPDSRPRQLLKAIVNCNNSNHKNEKFSYEKVKDGIEMQVAMRQQNASTEWKRWREVAAERMNANNHMNHKYYPKTTSSSSSSSAAIATSVVDSKLTFSVEPSQTTTAAMTALSHTIKLECRPCDNVGYEARARALIFGPTPLTIVACTNRLQSQAEVEEILTHELIHAYDLKCSNLDFSDCESMAYSEVRASKAAECSKSWTWRANSCIAQNATRAAQNRFPEQGRSCVRTVLDQALKDERPLMKDQNLPKRQNF